MLTVRHATGDDIPYVLDSFVHEFASSVYADGLSWTQVRKLILDCTDSGFSVHVLCESETPEEIMAWCLKRNAGEVAWVHTKGKYRRHGVARELLHQLGVERGKIKTPFIPSPAFAREARKHGWNLCHRPWMGSA